ncbi:MAG: hypothetical protein JWO62_119 [Acidimicrobiaceae bacterium]|nr:hypothetical protein [Acidimicrobiaceae bacterium]
MWQTKSSRRARVGASCAAALIGAVAATALAMLPARATSRAHRAPREAQIASPLLGDLLTFGYDNARSGDDPVDPRIAGLSSAPAWNDDALDGVVYGEPLIYDARAYVATEGDSVYAIAARTGKVLWRVHVGTPVSRSIIGSTPTLSASCGLIDPLGVTGTPVIDPTTNELFVAEETQLPGAKNWQHVRHWMVAISLSTHRELWHRDIDPPHGNNGASYYIPAEMQRPALTLLDGRIYASFGGLYGDCGQYHGFIVGVAQSGSGAVQSYEVPSRRQAAIWETNGALVSPQGDLYVSTGNGSSGKGQSFDEGDAVVELSPSLHRLGVWAPANWAQLSQSDADLGSGGPIQVPGTSLLFVAGKPLSNASVGYLMAEGHLEGVGRGAYAGSVCANGGAYGADASDVLGTGSGARTMIYVPCENGTVALEIHASSMRFDRVWSASTGSPNGSPVVAGGAVWALNWSSGHLYGMSPTTGRVFVQRSTEPLPHFAAPGIGDGMVVVPTTTGVEAFRALS